MTNGIFCVCLFFSLSLLCFCHSSGASKWPLCFKIFQKAIICNVLCFHGCLVAMTALLKCDKISTMISIYCHKRVKSSKSKFINNLMWAHLRVQYDGSFFLRFFLQSFRFRHARIVAHNVLCARWINRWVSAWINVHSEYVDRQTNCLFKWNVIYTILSWCCCYLQSNCCQCGRHFHL